MRFWNSRETALNEALNGIKRACRASIQGWKQSMVMDCIEIIFLQTE